MTIDFVFKKGKTLKTGVSFKKVIKYSFPKYDWAVAGYELCNTTRLVPQYFVLVVVIEYMVNLVHQTGGGEVVARITGDT